MTDESKTEPTAVSKTAEVAKDSTTALIERLATIVDKSVQDSTSRLSALESSLAKMEKSITELAQKPKAMQTPTDLPLEPAKDGGEEHDIGAKVEAPDTYQSNSVQSGITEEDKENSTDGAGLKMQKSIKKSNNITTTAAQRPSSGSTRSIGRESLGKEPNPLLKAAREVGYAGLEQIARDIKKGVYGFPPVEEGY